jgi:broad specificity phosphatase PhoE
MSEMIMIRHGQASFGGETYDRISPMGIEQSRTCAAFFHNSGYSFNAVFSGTLQRQRESAAAFIDYYKQAGIAISYADPIDELNEHKSEEIIRGILPLVIKDDPSFSEDAAKLMSSRASFQRVYEKVMLRWVSGVDDIPGLQRWDEFKSGVGEAIDKITDNAGRGTTAVVFTSGGVIAAAVQMALSIPDEKAIRLSWHIANGSLTRFKFSTSGFSLASFNCFSHLEREGKEMLTYR